MVGISVDCINFFESNIFHILVFFFLWSMLNRKRRIRILCKLCNCEYAWMVILFRYCLINWIIQVFSIYQEVAISIHSSVRYYILSTSVSLLITLPFSSKIMYSVDFILFSCPKLFIVTNVFQIQNFITSFSFSIYTQTYFYV